MPLRPPALDDRSFDDLVEEVVGRIPAHSPEWTNPRLGDPGRTLVELFAWLTDTLLYRVNLIPERQRLAFLRLLGLPMRPAVAARGLVSIFQDEDTAVDAVTLRPLLSVKGPVSFETRSELTVFPVTVHAFCKRPLTALEQKDKNLVDVVHGLQKVYHLDRQPIPYVTTPVFPGGAADPRGFDVIGQTVDKCLWLALLAARPELVGPVRQGLGKGKDGGTQLLNVGVMPALAVPALFEDIGPRARIPHVWEMSTGREVNGEPEYATLDVIADSSAGLTQRGVLRLVLPAPEHIGALTNDVRAALDAGVGDRPPRLDDPDRAARLVAWLRLRPQVVLQRLALSWVGINAVEIDQRQTLRELVVGVSDGTADQQMQLPAPSVEVETLQVQVEEPGRGYQPWRRVEDLATAGRDDPAYSLDSEAGTLRFGDGVRGRIPETGRRVRVLLMRSGGGRRGNLPAGTLAEISDPQDLGGHSVTRKLKVEQSLPTDGGDEAETLAEAERRIPARLRDGDRAVTAEDFRHQAASTPGVRLGRVEVLPRFLPQQRRSGVPGVVSVMVLPYQAEAQPPNPLPDRPFLEAVHAYLDRRRLVGTELYTIGCEYVPVGVNVAISLLDGFGHDEVIQAVRTGLRLYLWPLAPGGPQGTGWPLGRAVSDRELEVVVSRVPGVEGVAPVNVFERKGDQWQAILRGVPNGPAELALQPWQLPQLLAVVVVVGSESPTDLRGLPDPFADPSGVGVAIPVVPDVC